MRRHELSYTVQGERVKAPVLLSSASGFFFLSLSLSFCLFLSLCVCAHYPIACNDPVLFISKIRREYKYEWESGRR